jgi:uncharacterized membrane protein
MKRWLIFTAGLLLFAYPWIVYFGLSYFSLRYLALALGFIFLLRAALSLRQPKIFMLSMSGILISSVSLLTHQEIIIKLYPVLINLLFYLFFYHSLLHPPCIIEKFARMYTPHLSSAAINYTRKITKMWCLFFVINGAIALWTACCTSVKIWMFYNGLLSYILIGILFVSEFIYRQYARRKNYI